MLDVQTIDLIATSSEVRGGRAHIVGTGVTVADVAIARNYHGLDGDGIADWYGLTLPQVYAALASFYEHKEEIDDLIREQIRRAEALKENLVGSKNRILSG